MALIAHFVSRVLSRGFVIRSQSSVFVISLPPQRGHSAWASIKYVCKSLVFLTPFPWLLIYIIEFTQPPLLRTLFNNHPPPSVADIMSGCSPRLEWPDLAVTTMPADQMKIYHEYVPTSKPIYQTYKFGKFNCMHCLKSSPKFLQPTSC